MMSDPKKCKTCQQFIDEHYAFCPNCGQNASHPGKYSDFELGRIAATQDVREIVFKTLAGAGVIVSGLALLGTYGLYEGVTAKATDAVKADVRDYVADTRRTIETEMMASRQSIRHFERENTTLLARLAQDGELALTNFEELRQKQLSLLKNISNIAAEAEIAKKKLELIVADADLAVTLKDVVANFFVIKSIEARTRLIFHENQKDRVQKLISAHYFQINLNSDSENVVQFLPNGDTPIFVGNQSIAHHHVIYPIYTGSDAMAAVIGKNIDILEKISQVEVRFFANQAYNGLDWSMIPSFGGVAVDIYVNGVNLVSKRGRFVMPENPKRIDEDTVEARLHIEATSEFTDLRKRLIIASRNAEASAADTNSNR